MKKKPGLAVTIIDIGGPKKGKKMKDEIVLDDEEEPMDDEEDMEEYDDLEMEDMGDEEDISLEDEEESDKELKDMFKGMEPEGDEDMYVEGMMTAVKEDDKEAFKENLKAFIKLSLES